MSRVSIASLACLLATACAPATFGWPGAGPGAEPDLLRYRAAFVAAAGTRFVEIVPRERVQATILGQRMLWLGDHHASGALHRLQLALLRDLLASGARPVLCLEAIGTADEAAVARFVGGEGTLDQLRATVLARWPGSWLDDLSLDPAFYRALLTLAREHDLPVRALEPTPRLPLGERDAVIAANVRQAANAFPDRLVVVVVGQAHLLGEGALVARTALPGLVLGGEPPAPLAAAKRPRATAGDFLRSDGDLLWFAGLWR